MNISLLRTYEYIAKEVTSRFYIYGLSSISLISLFLSQQLPWISAHRIETVLSLLVTLFFSDLVTGITHIYLDNSIVKYNNTITDKFRIEFQEHHKVPSIKWNRITGYKAQYEMNMVFPFTLPLLFFSDLIHNHHPASILLFSFALFVTVGQATHLWAHARIHLKPIPKLVCLLQDYHIILNPQSHRIHHMNFEKNFSILNSWSNPLLNYLTKKYNTVINNTIIWIDHIF